MEGRGGRGRDCPRFFGYCGFSATVTGQVGKEMDIPFCAGQAVREEKGKSNVVAELGTTKLGSNPNVATDCCVVGAERPEVSLRLPPGGCAAAAAASAWITAPITKSS